MGNNQNQIIKQALEIVSENNRFALKSITNNSEVKKNFYKLSGEPGLPKEVEKDIEEMEKLKTDLEKRFDLDLDDDPKPVDPEPEDPEHKDDDSDLEDDDSGPERKDFNEYKRPTHTGLYAFLERISLEGQAKAIFQSDFEYAAEKYGLSKSEMRSMKQPEKDNFMRSLGLKTLKEILKMDPKQRADHMGVDYNDRLRMPSSRILNLNLGNNR